LPLDKLASTRVADNAAKPAELNCFAAHS